VILLSGRLVFVKMLRTTETLILQIIMEWEKFVKNLSVDFKYGE